jgi:hypothetical protein
MQPSLRKVPPEFGKLHLYLALVGLCDSSSVGLRLWYDFRLQFSF